jgi:hypothetical protein
MSNIKKVLDDAGNQVYPVTTFKAVRDENGNTLDGRMEEMEATFENASGEISDLVESGITEINKTVFSGETHINEMVSATTLIYDISANHGNKQYSALTEALQDVPSELHKGGLTVQYVDSSCHNYITYRNSSTIWNNSDISSWIGVDSEPTVGSKNLIESGGVFNNIGAFDISEFNATEGPHTLAVYSGLTEALNALPTEYRKGGMSVKYVQSSDNRYVQYRFILSGSFTDVQFANKDNWQIIDDSGVFDISIYNAVNGTPAQYSSLQAALDAVPEAKRVAGMSVRYINNNNRYKEYRHTRSTIINTWYSYNFVSDVEQEKQSESLTRPITVLNINNDSLCGEYCTNPSVGSLSPATETRDSYVIPVLSGSKYKITCPSRVAYSKEPFYNIKDGTLKTFVSSSIWSDTALEVPNGANALILTIDPTAQDTSCIVELVDSIDGKVLKDQSIDFSKLKTSDIYNVSAKFPTSGVDGGNKYTLQLAINIIPSADRKAGMIIKFIDSVSGEYDIWYFKADTIINKWFVTYFVNYRELDNENKDALLAYSGTIDLRGKYAGRYCTNTSIGSQSSATETRESLCTVNVDISSTLLPPLESSPQRSGQWLFYPPLSVCTCHPWGPAVL